MKHFASCLAIAAVGALASYGLAARAAPAPAASAPAGTYEMDLSHTSVIFRIDHIGLSAYTGRFTRVSGQLKFDPAQPAAQSVTAEIDATSLQTNYPEPAKLDFDAQIRKQFLAAETYPKITFRSTKVELTGPSTARITGDFTLHGVTKPVTLETTFNGGYPKGGMDPAAARIGFSAHGSFKRSDFGMKQFVPPPGTHFGVGDEIEVIIETEFGMK